MVGLKSGERYLQGVVLVCLIAELQGRAPRKVGSLRYLEKAFAVAGEHLLGAAAKDRDSVLFIPVAFFLRLHLGIAPSEHGVVVSAGDPAAVEDFLEPLQELEIVLVFAFDQFLDFDVFHYAQFGEGLLQYLEVDDELVVELGLPVHLVHGQFARVEDIDQLAVDGSSAQLFNLGQVDFEQVVNPTQKFASGHLDCVVGIDGDLVDHSIQLILQPIIQIQQQAVVILECKPHLILQF